MAYKTCKRCGREIGPGGTFCTNYCSAKYNNEQRKTRVEKACEQCGESTYNQKYCSIQCVGLASRKTVVTRKRDKGVRKPYARIETLTDDQVQAVIDQQNGKCAVCRRIPKRWVRDHCHTTGKLRGMTCWACNTSMGQLGDTSETLMRAVRYLQQFEEHVLVAKLADAQR